MSTYQVIQPTVSRFKVLTRPLPTLGLVMAADSLALTVANFASVEIRLAFNGQFDPMIYWRLWPVLGVILLAYAVAGLYPGVLISPVDEMRRTVLTTTLIYLCFSTAIFLFKEGDAYSRGVFLLAWAFSILAVLAARFLVRRCFEQRPWWGYPVLVMGAGKTGQMVIRMLHRKPGLGLKPVAVLDDDPQKWGDVEGVPVVGGLAMAPMLAQERYIPYAIAAMPGVPREKLLALLSRYGQTFHHMLIIPDLFGVASLWIATRDLGGILGLEVRQQLLLPGPRLTKTLIDYSITVVLGIVLLPLLGLIALLVKLDSPGPVFYGQTRIGRNGRYFKAWKFRSMYRNSDQILLRYLRENPDQWAVWMREHKLKDDPRVTRIGHFLRRTSLDELPQLWNVFQRQMSLVGPRPIVDEEVAHYEEKFELYLQVLPGITGLWQVSGRSDVSYGERVNLDAYYVRNWSVWLDLYILLRTIWVVVLGDGAY
ncbi:MAG: undecaprenyl-phosphate galactose phosphotransferase WbaP [Cyanobacteria bacterium P01_H01_bin.119]